MSRVRFEGVTKRFPGVLALADVSFDVASGSCHAICGENGAGKSTLGKVLAGIHEKDGGRVWLNDVEVHFRSPADARAAGVFMVHQELAFAENLSIAENLCLGALPARFSFVSRARMEDTARRMLASIETDLDVRRPMGGLTTGEQQIVQIASAVSADARVIVFDEPTSSLSQGEADHLYELMARLRAKGVTCLYVSHRMPEIYRLCDTITVLRDGRHAATKEKSALDETALVEAMIGRALETHTPRSLDRTPGDERLAVERFCSPGKFDDVSLSLRAGEIVGLAGLVGAGRSELAAALFGLDDAAAGVVRVDGQVVTIRSPIDAMAHGLGLVPEDRKRQGLVLGLSCRENLSLPILNRPQLSRATFIRRDAETALTLEHFRALRVRAPGPDFVVAGLSGGNQQKILLARWLAARCRVLILDEPTRGVDVGAKAEIHELIDNLACEGAAVLLISSELPELLRLSRRVLVLRHGRLAGALSRADASQEAIVRLMSGVGRAAA